MKCLCLKQPPYPVSLPLQTGGSLVAVVHGADGPLLESVLKTQLETEEKVLKGEAERVVVSVAMQVGGI